MGECDCCIGLYADGVVYDAATYCELGAALLLDKPILIIVVGDAVLPAGLERAAAAIERVSRDSNCEEVDRATAVLLATVQGMASTERD